MSKPDFEGFARAVMDYWPDHTEIDGFELQELAQKFGMIKPVPGGFNPDVHEDFYGVSPAPGEDWFEYSYTPRREPK